MKTWYRQAIEELIADLKIHEKQNTADAAFSGQASAVAREQRRMIGKLKAILKKGGLD